MSAFVMYLVLYFLCQNVDPRGPILYLVCFAYVKVSSFVISVFLCEGVALVITFVSCLFFLCISVIPRCVFCVRSVILCGCVDPRHVINCSSGLFFLDGDVVPHNILCVWFVILM